MKIKTGDKVKIVAGKDKGKEGKIIQVFPAMNKVVVDGVNMLSKQIRSRKQGEKGQKIEFDAPLAVSNVELICGKCKKQTRVGYKILTPEGKAKKKVRICKKCKEVIE